MKENDFFAPNLGIVGLFRVQLISSAMNRLMEFTDYNYYSQRFSSAWEEFLFASAGISVL